MAWDHAGAFKDKFKCSLCDKNPKNKKYWGCEKKAQIPRPLFVDERKEGDVIVQYRYYQCPVRFIPLNIFNWYKLYAYHKDFPSAAMPLYAKLGDRFREAMYLYQVEYNNALQEVNKHGR